MTFLVDRLPKHEDEDQAGEDLGGSNTSLTRSILDSLNKWSSVEWDPFLRTGITDGDSQVLSTRTLVFPSEDGATEDTKKYFAESQPLVNRQCPVRDEVIPSMLEHNTRYEFACCVCCLLMFPPDFFFLLLLLLFFLLFFLLFLNFCLLNFCLLNFFLVVVILLDFIIVSFFIVCRFLCSYR